MKACGRGMTLGQAGRRFGWPRRPPRSCELVLNYACNARCVFCYHPSFMLAQKEMPFADAARRLYAARERGAWIAYLIGGEITVRDDLPKIAALARRIGYPSVQIVTNGIRLSDPAFARSLFEAGANGFRISLHAPDAATHDALTAVPGAFRRSVRAIDNLRRLGAHVATNTVVNKLNYRLLPALTRWFIRELGVTNSCLIYAHYSGAMGDNWTRLQASYRRVAPFLREALEAYRDEGAPIEDRMLSNFQPCALPEYADVMAEWYHLPPAEDDLLFIPEGARGGVCAMKAAQRMKAASCRRCVFDGLCMGFEKEYFKLFGESDFDPVLERPARAPGLPPNPVLAGRAA
jgi:MoaA/NifB/PqqE/SkfB family radical SAM enzyme